MKHATAIQYLTKQEANDSTGRFKTPYFIVPNGVSVPSMQKVNFSENVITASFIGRLDMFHKGIDLLLDALLELHEKLSSALFHLNIYGPRRYDFHKIQEEIEKRGIADIASIHDEITGKEKEMVLMNTDIFIMTSRLS